jgi:hypothetical protein
MNKCLDLAAGVHAMYLGLDDNLRRIANQAKFERNTLVELAPALVDAADDEPFDRPLDPHAHTHALELQRFKQEVQDDATPDHAGCQGFDYV